MKTNSLLVRIVHSEQRPNDIATYYAGQIGRVENIYRYSTGSKLVSVKLSSGTKVTLPSRYVKLIER